MRGRDHTLRHAFDRPLTAVPEVTVAAISEDRQLSIRRPAPLMSGQQNETRRRFVVAGIGVALMIGVYRSERDAGGVTPISSGMIVAVRSTHRHSTGRFLTRRSRPESRICRPPGFPPCWPCRPAAARSGCEACISGFLKR